MVIRFLLFILPALAVADIYIELSGRFDPNSPNMRIDFSGEQVGIITDTERRSFGLNGEARLKDAVNAYYGRRPTDAFLTSPTPWNDLYQTYGWDQVIRTLVPRSAKILGISSQPTIVVEQHFENNSTIPATFNVGISQAVENTYSSSWSRGGELSVGQEISYGFDIVALNGGATLSYSYTASWGRNTQRSESVTVGSSASIEVLLQPGQGVVTQLQATRGSIEVEVEYEASLSGHVAVNYNPRYRGHHFWALDVQRVMASAGLTNQIVSRERITIGFFSESRISVRDMALKTLLLEAAV